MVRSVLEKSKAQAEIAGSFRGPVRDSDAHDEKLFAVETQRVMETETYISRLEGFFNGRRRRVAEIFEQGADPVRAIVGALARHWAEGDADEVIAALTRILERILELDSWDPSGAVYRRGFSLRGCLAGGSLLWGLGF